MSCVLECTSKLDMKNQQCVEYLVVQIWAKYAVFIFLNLKYKLHMGYVNYLFAIYMPPLPKQV